MAQRVFNGTLYRNELFADNRNYYRQVLQKENPQSKEYETALKYLDILERFPPEIPHNRIIAHRVSAHEISEPKWMVLKNELVPMGRLKKVFSADIGEMLKSGIAGENEFISVGFRGGENQLNYSAIIGGKKITAECPLEFHFRQYLNIDGVEISSETSSTDIVRPVFAVKYENLLQVPGKLLGFRYSKAKVLEE